MTSIETLGGEKEGRLHELEAQLRDGLSASIRVGEALREIRDEQLYLIDFGTFQEYCEARWELSRSRAYQLIEAAEVTDALSKELDTRTKPPTRDAHARALAPLKDRPKDMAEAWREAQGERGDHIRAEDVRKAVERRQRPQEPPQRPPEAPPEPTPIEAALADTLPESTGTHHYTTGLVDAIREVSREAYGGHICVKARRGGEVEVSWRDLEGNPSKKLLNRHGNPPKGHTAAA